MTDGNQRDTSPASDRARLANIKRRSVLATLGAGLTGLAGCGGDGDGDTPEPTPTDPGDDIIDPGTDTGGANGGGNGGTETPWEPREDLEMVDQELQVPMFVNPEDLSLLNFSQVTWATDAAGPFESSAQVESHMNEPRMTWKGNHPAWDPAPGEIWPGVYKSLEFKYGDDADPPGIYLTIQEDANWSDGEPVTARDAASQAAAGYHAKIANPIESKVKWATYGDLRFPDGREGKKVIFVNDGSQDRFTNNFMRRMVTGFRWGIREPTHIEPLKTLAEDSIDAARAAARGESHPLIGIGGMPATLEKYITEETFQKWRKPENALSHGPFKLKEIRGTQEVVLEKNPEFRNADRVNFSGVRFSYAPSTERRVSELNSGNYDTLGENLAFGQSSNIPDKYEIDLSLAGEGDSLGIRHQGPLGEVPVRRAMAYALNQKQIKPLGENRTSAVTTPGADAIASNVVVGQDFLDSMIDYSRDVEKANSLMQDAGYEKNSSGVWVSPDGEEMSYELATPRENTAMESTVAQQLSNFGIEVQVQPYDFATFEENIRQIGSGPNLYPDPYSAGVRFYNNLEEWWFLSAHHLESKGRHYEYYGTSEEMQALYDNQGTYLRPPGNPAPADAWDGSQDVEGIDDTKIPLPTTAGDPDSEIEEVNIPQQASLAFRAGALERDEEYWQNIIWATNYWMPVIPLYQTFSQTYYNDANWIWPTGHEMWEDHMQISVSPATFVTHGWVYADPENPK